MTVSALPRRIGAAGTAALALVLAVGWVLGTAMPAVALHDTRLVSPQSGAQITGPITIEARVETGLAQTERVEARLRRGGETVGDIRALDHRSGPRSGGTSTWNTPLDPMSSWATGGGPMPNGTYRIEVRSTTNTHTGEWTGVDVHFNVAPPKTTANARVLDGVTRSVEVTWTQVSLPDFEGYVVQRSKGTDGSWTDVSSSSSSSSTRTVDIAPDHGTWRYRVIVQRAGAGGSTLTSTSDPVTVDIEPPAAPTPDSDADDGVDDGGNGDGDGGNGNGDGGNGDGGNGNGNGGNGNGDGGDNGGNGGGGGSEARDEREPRQGAEAFTPRRRQGSAPRVATRNVPRLNVQAPQPDAAPPRPRDPGQEVFEETLGYDLEPREITERETVREPGDGMAQESGTIRILERELVLEQVLPSVAGGLLLFVLAGHVLRFARIDDD